MKYEIYRFGKIDSTNSHLLRLGEEGFPEGTVVLADEQTGGRGRFGRKWEAEPSANLLFSVLLRPSFLGRDDIFILTFAAAVAVAEGLEEAAGVRTELKWPNDIMIDSRKVCGILLESGFEADSLTYVVLGIGVNVNQSGFPGEISGKATSLALSTGRTFDREGILSAILGRFSSQYETIRLGDFYPVMKGWKSRTRMFGKKIKLAVGERTIEGICEDVGDDGALVIRTEFGLEKFTAGEVSISKNNQTGTGGKF